MNDFRISPIQVGRMILEPIKHFFHTNSPDVFRWDPDEKKTKVDISMINDAHKESVDDCPQILVSRGGFRVEKTGLSDNMSEQKTMTSTFGLMDRTNFLMYSGQASVIIRGRNEGTVEVLTDMVLHVLQWSRPHICDILGFKDFALPMTVSDVTLTSQHTEIFEVTISVPYILEEAWRATNDALLLRDVFINITKSS